MYFSKLEGNQLTSINLPTIQVNETFHKSVIDKLGNNIRRVGKKMVSTTPRRTSEPLTKSDEDKKIPILGDLTKSFTEDAPYGTQQRTYLASQKQKMCGRVYPSNGDYPIHRFNRQLRYHVCNEHYVDIDIKNAHPVLLTQLLRKNGFTPPKSLIDYCENRDTSYFNIRGTTKLTRDEQKNFFLVIMNGGSIGAWRYNNPNVPNDFRIPQKWMTFHNEVRDCMKKVHDMCLNDDKVKFLTEIKDASYGTPLACINQIVESHILFAMIMTIDEYVQEQDPNHEVLVSKKKNLYITDLDTILLHDGMITSKEYINKLCDLNNQDDIDEFLKLLMADVEEKTGYKVEIKIKPMENNPQEPLHIYDPNIWDEQEKRIMRKIERGKVEDTFRVNSLRTFSNYAWMKNYFELYFCKVKATYYQFNKETGDMRKLLKKDLTEAYNDIYVKKTKTVFLDKWLKDEDKRRYDDAVFDPSKTLSDNILNLYTDPPFARNKYTVSDEHITMVSEFLKIVRLICENNEYYMNVFLTWIKYILLEPANKNKSAISFAFTGNTGSGKSMVAKVVGSLCGQNNYAPLSTIEDFTSRFSGLYNNKIFCSIDESKAQYSDGIIEKLKSLITNDTTEIEGKGFTREIVGSYTRFMFCSNKASCVPIDTFSNDRRYIIFKQLNRFDDEFYKKMGEYVNDNGFLQALYNHITTLPYEYNLSEEQRKCKNSDGMSGLLRKQLTIEQMFLVELVKNYKESGNDRYITFTNGDPEDMNNCTVSTIEKASITNDGLMINLKRSDINSVLVNIFDIPNKYTTLREARNKIIDIVQDKNILKERKVVHQVISINFEKLEQLLINKNIFDAE